MRQQREKLKELPVLNVYLDNPMTGEVLYRPDTPGVKWRRAKSIYDASSKADAFMSTPRTINYVDRK